MHNTSCIALKDDHLLAIHTVWTGLAYPQELQIEALNAAVAGNSYPLLE